MHEGQCPVHFARLGAMPKRFRYSSVNALALRKPKAWAISATAALR